MDNEVPIQNTGGKNSRAIKRIAATRLPKQQDNNSARGSQSRPCAYVACPPTLSPSKIMQLLKGRSSKILQEEFEALRKRYWGQHLWATGYFCSTVGAVTDEMLKEYVESQHDEKNENFKIIE